MSDLNDALNPVPLFGTSLVANPSIDEVSKLVGRFSAVCFDKDGNIKWEEPYMNTVVTVGKNHLLSTLMTGSAYTVTGPFMGLISNASFTSIAAGDTMSSHSGWIESGGSNAPTYTGTRPTMAFSAASAGAIATSAAVAYSITSTGTLNGAFVVLGTGALTTKDNTGGTLFSAGSFAATRGVANGDTLNVSYSLSV